MPTGTVISSESGPHSASITWTIDAFKDLIDCIRSPPIHLLTGIRFQQLLYPKSFFDNDVYLIAAMHYPPEKDLVFRVSTVKANGDMVKCYSKDTSTLGEQYLAASYIKRAEVLKEEKEYLVDGKLTVYCEVEVVDKGTGNEKHSADVQQQLLLNDYESAIQEDGHDLTLVVGGKEFHVHKNILTSRSPVFGAMLNQEICKTEDKVEIPDVSVEAFERLLRSIYALSSLEKHAEELLPVANKYQMDDLKFQCTQGLIRRITTESAISLLLLADMHQSGELKSECIEYIAANLASVQATEGWKHLEKNGAKHSDLLFELFKALVKVK